MTSIVRLHLLLFAGVVVLAPAAASAQPATPPPPPPLREGTAEFAFVGTSGNSSTQSIGLGGELIYRPAPWTLTSKAAYVRNDSDGTLKAESIDLSQKVARTIRPRLSAFGRYGFLHDRFAGIDQRHVAEGGLSYLLVDDLPRQSFTVDGSLGYAHEERLVGPSLSNPTAAAGALYRLKINDAVDASDDARLNASLSQGDDWRAANIAALTSKLTTILSLKVSNTIRYVNAPVIGFQKTDTITAIALVAKF